MLSRAPSPSFPGQRRSRRAEARASRSTSSATSVAEWIESSLSTGPVVDESYLGSSSWSSQYVIKTAQGASYFAKTARGRDDSMFKGEALGLQAMYDTKSIRVPKVFHYGLLDGPGRPGSFIVMEHLDLSGREDQAQLGKRLAQMHLATPKDPNAASGQFGFAVDNTIGGTHQPNTWGSDWVTFFREQRLGHMLQLAGDAQLTRLGQQLLPELDRFFEGVEVKPSVLHGDLWSGNIGSAGGEPVIFDPAVYHGHHEAEFGMMWCAGLSPSFWKAYNALIPRAPGWESRNQLYQLYHYLNHYIMFGGGYYGTCQRIMQDLVDKL